MNKLTITPVSVIVWIAFLLAGYSIGRIMEKQATEKARQELYLEQMRNQQVMRQASIARYEGYTRYQMAESILRRLNNYRDELKKAHVLLPSEPDSLPPERR